MKTQHIPSTDNVQIAYDQNGAGPAIILLHGGGSNRQVWHNTGYVERLQENFKVITLDLRGHGESDLPTDPANYRINTMGQDILTVADACGAKNFDIWGMSFGGNVSRYLAVKSDRVKKIILMGVKLGANVTEEIRDDIERFCKHWPPILEAQRAGTLEMETLTKEDREFLAHFNVPVMMAWGRAMLDWPFVEPANFRCPVLWLVGSEDKPAMESATEYRQCLKDTSVKLHIVEGLNHGEVFDEIDRVFETMVSFTKS